MIKKCHYETLSETNPESKDLLKEISANEIQLRQLLINEEVLVNRMKGLQRNEEQLMQKIRKYIGLADKWINVLVSQVEHEKEIVKQIPIDGDIILTDAEKMSETQQSIIEKLKEQLELRDAMIEKTKEELKRHDKELDIGSDIILTFDEVIKTSQEEHSNATKGKNLQLPAVQQSSSMSPEFLKRFSRFTMSSEKQLTEIARRKKEGKQDKQNHSLVSRDSSFSTGASSGAMPMLGLLGKQSKR